VGHEKTDGAVGVALVHEASSNDKQRILYAMLMNLQCRAEVPLSSQRSREAHMRMLLTFVVALLPFAVQAQVKIQTFDLPKDGGYPHDLAVGADGMVWYTAQRAGKLGRLDPATGKVDLVPLGDGAAPHGVIIGPDGAPWVTEGGRNAIVRVDPQTLGVKAWPLPQERGYVNLNTASFDGRGRIWFTGQNGVYGRLDPKNDEMRVWDAPRGRGPYGIASTPDGQVYYASLA